jgi:hypothetical protein
MFSIYKALQGFIRLYQSLLIPAMLRHGCFVLLVILIATRVSKTLCWRHAPPTHTKAVWFACSELLCFLIKMFVALNEFVQRYEHLILKKAQCFDGLSHCHVMCTGTM